MKVLIAAADSGALKNVEFGRDVDTSNPESKQPTIDTVVPGTGTPKKADAITHFCSFERFTVIARSKGDVLIEDKVIFTAESKIVGLNRVVVPTGAPDKQTRKHAVIISTASGASQAILLESNGAVFASMDFQLRDGLSSVVNDSNSPLTFASAGAETLPDVFKLVVTDNKVEVEQKWIAEALPNDRLDLPVPNLVSALAFVDGNRLVTVTSKGSLRVYDTEGDKQPIASTIVSKYALKCIASDPKNPGTVIVGDANTLVSRWSVAPLKLLGTYRGVIGSTRSISIRGDYVAMGGLDRYIRVFNITRRQAAGKVYVGDEIWALELVRTDYDEDMTEMDNMWETLDTTSKRRKIASSESESAGVSDSVRAEEESSGEESPFDGFDD